MKGGGYMPNKLIKDLIDKGAVTLKEQGYSIRSREYTLLTWKQFQEFCNKRDMKHICPRIKMNSSQNSASALHL